LNPPEPIEQLYTKTTRAQGRIFVLAHNLATTENTESTEINASFFSVLSVFSVVIYFIAANPPCS
jgi:hypothetical protein